MVEMEKTTHDPDQQEEEPWEERTLNLLKDSKIDQEFSEAKSRKRGGRKRKLKWLKRPMAMSEIILELLNEELRENALRCLSSFLIEKREDDLDNYYRAGFLVFHSCSTMAILLQELVEFFIKMRSETPNVRSIKRLANVLTLFQSIAANNETRQQFIDSRVPNFLIPLIQFESTVELFDNIRAIALSVIGILCQGREPKIIQWAIESDMVEVCRSIVEIGSELTKVIAMHIIEAILQDKFGISNICNSTCDHILNGLMETWDELVNLLVVDQDFSPRLLFHIVRCYIILCTHDRGYSVVMKSLPDAIKNNSFLDMTEEFPIISNLLHQLLLNVGKVTEDPMLRKQLHVHPAEEKISLKFGLCTSDSVSHETMPLKSIDINQSPDSLQYREVYT